MKTKLIVYALLTAAAVSASPEPIPPATESRVRVMLLDDQSSPDLQKVHGITRTTETDLRRLTQHFIDQRSGCRVAWMVVTECSIEDKPVILELPVFSVPPPTMPNLRGLTSTQIRQKAESLQATRIAFEQAATEFTTSARTALDEFIASILKAQMLLDVRFSKTRAELHGWDFPRSDIVGAVTKLVAANPVPTDMRFLVLRTDGVDFPGGRTPKALPYRVPRVSALTEAELPRDVVLVFINTSGKPDSSPLFSGNNPRLHFKTFDGFLAWLSGAPVQIAASDK